MALDREIAAFEENRDALEASSMGKWVLIHGNSVIGTFHSFDAAAERAVRDFGKGPYLIRQIGSSTVSLPTSAMFHLV